MHASEARKIADQKENEKVNAYIDERLKNILVKIAESAKIGAFTHYAKIYCCSNQSSISIAKILKEKLCKEYGYKVSLLNIEDEEANDYYTELTISW